MNTIKRVFLFEPCFGNMTGHWESNCRRFHDEFKRLGIPLTVFCQTNPNPAIVNGLNVIPAFSSASFADISTPQAFDQETDNFAADYSQIDATQFKDGDLLLFTTVMPQSHKATMAWLAPIIKPKGPKAAFIFMIGAGDFEGNFMNKKLTLALLKLSLTRPYAMRKLYTWKKSLYKDLYSTYIHEHAHKRESDGYFYFGGCEEYAMNFRSIFGVPVRTLPFPTVPVDHQTHEPVKAQHPNSAINIGYFGHASLEKGAQFLENVVKRITKQYPQVNFHLHINPNIHTIDILKVFDAPMHQVTCYHGHRSQEELSSLIKSVDINLLPYAPVKYAGLPSMVFTEAMSVGSVVVVPEYTWLSRTAKSVDAGYVAFNKYNEQSIYQALAKSIEQYPKLKRKTNAAKETFMRKNNVQTYIGEILSAITQKA